MICDERHGGDATTIDLREYHRTTEGHHVTHDTSTVLHHHASLYRTIGGDYLDLCGARMCVGRVQTTWSHDLMKRQYMWPSYEGGQTHTNDHGTVPCQ